VATEGLILERPLYKSSIETSGAFSLLGSIDIIVISRPWGSEGQVGTKKPSDVYMNLVAVWHLRTGIIIASLTTIVISDPEYPSA